jgi:hypothetical protein
MDHSSGSIAQDQDRFRLLMKEHGKVDKILDGGDVRDRCGDRWDPIGKEGELFASFRDSNISIDGIFIVDDIEISPLQMDRGLVNRP